MAWIVTGVLAVITMVVFSLYWGGIRERNHLLNLIFLILIHDDVHQAQKAGLRAFVTETNAKDAAELIRKAMQSTTNLADRVADKTMLTVPHMLWKVREDGGA